ncbi:MAG: hypothetical protein GY869_15280, partial [Planctomycetes bacterium]|nr:hypothetical protein [Planctomycetota bacterium]
GTNKHIEWDFYVDNPGVSGNNFRVRVLARDSIFVEIDRYKYKTVKIGDQIWMAENLKVTRYRNGDVIPRITDNTTWGNLTTGAQCEYNNDLSFVDTYGRLYNWFALVDSRNISPAGWHVPTYADWQTLVDFLGGSSVAGGKMKEAGSAHWTSPNTGATNASGFCALPGGYRGSIYNGNFYYMGSYAFFWYSTEFNNSNAWYRYLDY